MGDSEPALPHDEIRIVRILQIGDLHFPEWGDEPPAIDRKDSALSPSLADNLALSPIQLVLRELATMVYERDFALIAQMGDVTSRGDLDQYKIGLKQLSLLLNVRSLNRGRNRAVLVPGNHDVDRATAILGVDEKFSAIIEIAKSLGWPTMPTRNVQRIDLHQSISAFLLNTCLGCGERRYIPPSVQAALKVAIDDALDGPAPSITLDQYYEQLDTPALDEDVLRKLGGYLRRFDSNNLPIVIAHHNVLPQLEPRLAPYSELVNAGQLRRLMTDLDRPIVYLHGHIHDDPVEIISIPNKKKSKLISISAPSLVQGFNEISVYLARNGTPCGLRITPFRYRGAAGVVQDTPIDLPLVDRSHKLTNKLAYQIIEFIATRRQVFWNELYEEMQSKGDASEEEVSSAVLELYFSSYLSVEAVDAPYQTWHIEMG